MSIETNMCELKELVTIENLLTNNEKSEDITCAHVVSNETDENKVNISTSEIDSKEIAEMLPEDDSYFTEVDNQTMKNAKTTEPILLAATDFVNDTIFKAASKVENEININENMDIIVEIVPSDPVHENSTGKDDFLTTKEDTSLCSSNIKRKLLPNEYICDSGYNSLKRPDPKEPLIGERNLSLVSHESPNSTLKSGDSIT